MYVNKKGTFRNTLNQFICFLNILHFTFFQMINVQAMK